MVESWSITSTSLEERYFPVSRRGEYIFGFKGLFRGQLGPALHLPISYLLQTSFLVYFFRGHGFGLSIHCPSI